MKKFSKEWFENKMLQYKNMMPGYSKVLTATKGFKANGQNKKQQRIDSLLKLANEKGVKINE